MKKPLCLFLAIIFALAAASGVASARTRGNRRTGSIHGTRPAPKPAPPQPPPPPLPPSGSIPAAITIRLTGQDVPTSFLLRAAEESIRKQVRLNGAGNISVDTSRAFVVPGKLTPGGQTTAIIPVRIYVPSFRPVEGRVIVVAENIGVQGYRPPEKIFVSNSPESVGRTGEMLAGEIDKAVTARFVVHHKNTSGRELKFVFYIFNPGDEPALVRIIGENVFYTSDKEMTAGHLAAARFLKTEYSGLGSVIELPPRRLAIINRSSLAPRDIISGLLELQSLRGRIKFSIRFTNPDSPDDMPLDKIGDLTTKRAHGEFSAPFLEVDEQYTIGDRWKFIPVGVQPIESADERINRLEGNYGVTYRINITLENPQPTPEKANISFAPGGGPAFGSIFVDDKFFQTSLARPPDDITIATYTLQPGERKRIRVETIPESGSNYPIRIIVKSRKIQ